MPRLWQGASLPAHQLSNSSCSMLLTVCNQVYNTSFIGKALAWRDHQLASKLLASSPLVRVHEIHPSASELDKLDSFPFLHGSLSGLKSELPAYLAAAEDVSPDLCPLEFWRRHKDSLPSWAAALQKGLLVQPSSAASEWVF